MKKFLSGLLCAAMTASLFTVMTGGASADSIAVDPNWQYKTMVDFEDLQQGYQFVSGTSDPCTLYIDRGQGWQAKVNVGGYKGSNCFYLYSKSDKKGDYAQPLINAQGFTKKNTEFVGATEFWMWVDFSHVEFDEVGLQFRLVEDDYNPDGSRAGVDLSQLAVGKGKPIYIQSGSSWKSIANTGTHNYLLPVEQMKGYKGFIRIPLTSLVMHKDGTDDDGKINLLNVTQAWFIFNWPNKNPATDYLSVDQLMFVGPSLKDGKSISKIQLGADATSTSAATQAASNGGNTTAAAKSNTSTSALTASTTLANSLDVASTDETEMTTEEETTTTALKTTQAVDEVSTSKAKGSSAVPIVIAIVCVVLIGGGAAVYFFVIKKKSPNGLIKK